MTEKYVVNKRKQSNGDHEVHRESCQWFPNDYEELGYYSTCYPAVAKAKSLNYNANGCRYCCSSCHTT